MKGIISFEKINISLRGKILAVLKQKLAKKKVTKKLEFFKVNINKNLLAFEDLHQ